MFVSLAASKMPHLASLPCNSAGFPPADTAEVSATIKHPW